MNLGVKPREALLGSLKLRATDVAGREGYLSLKVCEVHHVKIHQSQPAHARRSQIEAQRRAQAAGAHQQYFGLLELALALHPDLGHDQVAAIAEDLFFGKLWLGLR